MITFTEETLLLAQKARKEKREQGLATYRQDWLDDQLWVELAKEASNSLGVTIKLPQKHVPPSGIKLDRIARQLGLPEDWAQGFFGCWYATTSAAIKKENSCQPDGMKYNMRMFVGHLLELWKETQK